MTKEGAEQRGATDVDVLIYLEVVENGQQVWYLGTKCEERKQDMEKTYDIV